MRGFLDAVKLKDEWIADMQKDALILESRHSTHIEGTTLTNGEIGKIFKMKAQAMSKAKSCVCGYAPFTMSYFIEKIVN